MSRLALAAATALLCMCSVSARTLKQDTAAPIWANFTMEAATLYSSVKMILPPPQTDTLEKCAEACLADAKCVFWSWCPASVTAGCGVAGANGTTSSTLKPKTCILSWDESKDSLAVFAMYGEDSTTVPWWAGMYRTPAEAGSEAAVDPGIPIKIPGLSRRRLLADPPTTAAVWGNFSYEPNTVYLAVDRLGSAAVKSAEECALQCQASDVCEFWALCPAAQAAGCTLPGQGSGPGTVVPAGQCITTGDAVKNRTAVFTVLGKAVVFESGTRTGPLPSDPPPPSPSPSPVPSPSPGAPPAPVDGPEAWVDPAADGPAECQGFFAGNEWGKNDEEIECHFCENESYQLKCDYDSGWIGATEVNCEVDRAGLGSFAFNAIEFSCPVNHDKEINIECDWKKVQDSLPGCAWEPTRRILATWRPGK